MIITAIAFVSLHRDARITSIEALPSATRHPLQVRGLGGNALGYAVGMTTVFIDGRGGPGPQVWTPKHESVLLPIPPKGQHAILRAINKDGTAVGEYQLPQGEQMFIWDAKAGKEITPNLGVRSSAWGINDDGVILGDHMQEAEGHFIGIKYVGGHVTELPPANNYLCSLATHINATGTIVGYSYGSNKPNKDEVATVWKEGQQPKTLPLLPGTTLSTACCLNDAGTVVGECHGGSAQKGGGFIYDGNGIKEIPNLGQRCLPAWINNSGQVVGTVVGKGSSESGFIFQDGQSTDLNVLLPPNSGWKIEEANWIGEDGTIVGSGRLNGKPCAFVLHLAS